MNLCKTKTLTQMAVFIGCFSLVWTAHAMIPTGKTVKKINQASHIRDFHPVDNRHLVISISNNKNFLLTLQRDCPSLRFASNLSVSASNNTIYAGFDYVTADGSKCGIESISKLSKDEKKALTRA